MRAFVVQPEPLDAGAVTALVQTAGHGGVVTFVGAVRDATQGRRVVRLEYEAYASMAEKQLAALAEEAQVRWPGLKVAIAHRVGTLAPGEAAVVIAVSAPHRAEAFAACQQLIERLKQDVPIWKKEFFEDGAVWVGLGP
jgi:MoaE-MoaD fusion protein